MDAIERKTRPIYDALDAGNPKQALALCNKSIKKSASASIFKALKALALERLDRPEDALHVCAEVRATAPTDEPVLQTLSLVYRATSQHNELVAMYDAAYKQLPNNEELANHWFMAQVRSGLDAKELQQSAIKLNKQFGNKSDRYLFWTILAIYLQALPSPSPSSPTDALPLQNSLNLSLADRMIAKLAAEKKLKDQEQLLLYLMILEARGKYQEAVNLLSGDLRPLCPVQSDYARLMAGLYKSAGNLKALEHISLESLSRNSDDWESVTNYFLAIFHTNQSVSLEETKKIIQGLQQKALTDSPSKPHRGPFLAELELIIRMVRSKQLDSSALVPLIIEYFNRFGVNFSCFDDLRPALNALSNRDSTQVVRNLREKYDVPDLVEDDSIIIDTCKRQVNIRKIERLATPVSTSLPASVAIEVDLLLSRYDSALRLGSKLTEKERQYGDDYLLLACHYLIDLFQSTGDVTKLFESAALLEMALTKSKFNFQFKILLICIYRELGVYIRTLDVAQTLDIKQILHDTLSYIYNDDLEVFGSLQAGTTNPVLRSLLRSLTIYSSNERETPEMIVRAFQYSTFSKIPEFIRFRDKLRYSLQRAICLRQITRIEVLRRWNLDTTHLQTYLETVEPDWMTPSSTVFDVSDYFDNRDVTIMADWQATNADDEELSKGGITARVQRGRVSPRNRSIWLKLHILIPKILRSICGASAAVDPTNESLLKQVLTEAEKSQDPNTICECKVGRIVLGLTKIHSHVHMSLSGQQPVENGCFDDNAAQPDIMALLQDLLKACSTYENEPTVILSQDWLRNATLLLEAITYCLVAIQAHVAPASRKPKANFLGPTYKIITPPFSTLSDDLKAITTAYCEGVLSNLSKRLKGQSKQQMCQAIFATEHGRATRKSEETNKFKNAIYMIYDTKV
ncbi:hypothetical protein SeMB42_g06936 [Synchytrium endobioticum]|uniref:N-terminal acetyltransferase B complex subunit MDM20 homolog n=1 Tax=Synchytrium endobioticum TaxID=286115 RepID=A0A507CI05_9FUNG|nr:hypothetical protein SeMB42_g06936 [Synchytrium endobioticum]TPX40733.1 hypothetical protein SeLEV6574_g06438 [Synchytrium endobioticum]